MRKQSLFCVFAAFSLLGNAFASDGNLESSIKDLLSCQSITDDAPRLACFDAKLAVVSKLSETAAIENIAPERIAAAPPQIAPEPAAPRKETLEEFGAERLPDTVAKQKKQKLPKISDDIVEIAFDYRKKAVIILENGQVWKQLNSDSTRIMPSRNRKYTATIKRASMGSYMLRIEELKRSIRVKRIK